MKERVCLNCDYFKTKSYIFFHKCKCSKLDIKLNDYLARNYVCDSWKADLLTQVNFRKVDRDDGCW